MRINLISDDELYHFNPYHDKLGRFSSRNGFSSKTQNNKGGNEQNKSDNKTLSDKQKKILKIGAAAVGTALLTYGAYKVYQSGTLDKLRIIGKNKIDIGLADHIEPGNGFNYHEIVKPNEFGFKKYSVFPKLASTVESVNPLRGTKEGANNCTHCAIAGFLRSIGYKDVTAKTTNGQRKNLGELIGNCFRNATILDGTAVKFGKSPKDAEEFLLKRFGEGSKGIASIGWKSGGGHAFNWEIVNGKAHFIDCQLGKVLENDTLGNFVKDKSFGGYNDLNNYWNKIDENAGMTICRLDNAKPIFEELNKVVNH